MTAQKELLILAMLLLIPLRGYSQLPGEKLWEFVTGGTPAYPPAVDEDGALYFGSSAGKFYALNPNGAKRWEFPAAVLTPAALGPATK